MQLVSYSRHRFPPEIIRHAVWLYHRFTLSMHDVEELLTERGLEDMLVQPRRNKAAAVELMRKLLKNRATHLRCS